jgi:hypothetical protein
VLTQIELINEQDGVLNEPESKPEIFNEKESLGAKAMEVKETLPPIVEKEQMIQKKKPEEEKPPEIIEKLFMNLENCFYSQVYENFECFL